MMVYKCERCGIIKEHVKDIFRLHIYRLGVGNEGKREHYDKQLCKECFERIKEVIEKEGAGK